MASKPTVVLEMPADIVEQMLTERDLLRLGEAAEIEMPPDDETPRADVLAVLTGWGSPRFTAERLEQYPSLGLIAHTAGTVRSVVSDAVFEKGIRVTTSALPNAVPVAEYTVAMMVMMLKQVPWLALHVRDGGWSDHGRPVRELRDLKVGVIGASRVGREVIERLKAFPRLTIRVYDPYLGDLEAQRLGVERVDLESACECEVVTIHAPALPETEHLLNRRRLRLLPDHAVLINTSRGSLVDEKALVDEVRRRPLYVCLDVTDPEPPSTRSRLRAEPNILITPHIAGAMNQARKDMGALAIDQVIRFLAGDAIEHEVTREGLAQQA